MKQCLYCKKKAVKLLYPANNRAMAKKPDYFACTNCGYGAHGPIVQCSKCKMIYVDEAITQKEISDFYEISEDPLYLQEQKAREKTFRHYLSKMEKAFPNKGKLLDIGTNTGLFVKVARESGWEAFGLEPGKQAAEYAKKKFGLDLINKPFEDNTFPVSSFDVVTMWDVIEHFTDPVVELKKINNILKPQGLLCFSTVDPYSLVARLRGSSWPWYMEMHRVLIGKESAEYYLKRVGFKNIIFQRHWRFFSLGYTAKLWISVSPLLAKLFTFLGNSLGISRIVVPYYASDLYDCYSSK